MSEWEKAAHSVIQSFSHSLIHPFTHLFHLARQTEVVKVCVAGLIAHHPHRHVFGSADGG